MPYANQFAHADAVMADLAKFVPSLADPQLRQKYIGFATVAAVPVYELAIKDIFVEFAGKKHQVFEVFVKSAYARLNGRIKPSAIKDDYVPQFGSRYIVKYKATLDKGHAAYLRQHRRDFLNSYNNLVTWRHNFVHLGQLPTTVTFPEVVQAYDDGKQLIHCLAASMRR
jgi:hypothetical protein